MIPSASRAAVSLVLALLVGSCDGEGPRGVDLTRPVAFEPDAAMPKRLSALNLFAWEPAAGFSFNTRVVPYDLNTPLFSDYALKQRAIYLPEGTTITYSENGVLQFPVGTILIKNFYFPADLRAPTEGRRLIETRLLVHRESGWEPFPYIWNAAQTDAELRVTGEVRDVSFIAADGTEKTSSYLIPQTNQCRSCHGTKTDEYSPIITLPIGPTARNLNRDYDFGGEIGSQNQLEHLASLGMLSGLPSIASVDQAYDFAPIEAHGLGGLGPAEIDRAARDYLEVNCAHCHNPASPSGIASQFFLTHTETDPYHLGICKRPGSAGIGYGGLDFDLVPGDAERSILHYRMHSEQPGAIMPVLGRSLRHEAGVELIGAWIDAMAPVDCSVGP